MASVDAKATAITVLTPLRREGPLVLMAVFWAGRHIRETRRWEQEWSRGGDGVTGGLIEGRIAGAGDLGPPGPPAPAALRTGVV